MNPALNHKNFDNNYSNITHNPSDVLYLPDQVFQDECYIFDIDGTIANASDRLHFIKKVNPDWDAFYAACVNDKPIKPVIDVLNALFLKGHIIVFTSGRSNVVFEQTMNWIQENTVLSDGDYLLYMRPIGSYEQDAKLKHGFLKLIRKRGLEPAMVFEDRQQCVNMWRDWGIPCAQVAEGDF